MIEKLGPDCTNCQRYRDFYDGLHEEEELCAVMAKDFSTAAETRIIEARFVCTALMKSRCNVQISSPRLELTPKAEN